MKSLVLLGILLLLLIVYIWTEKKEGWEDLQQAVDDTMSPFAEKVSPTKNPLAPIGISEDAADATRDLFSSSFNRNRLVKKGDGTFEIDEPSRPVAARVDDTNTFLGRVKFCADRGKQGNPFSDPEFVNSCGMCMTKGKLITGETFTGPTGIYITSDDKAKALRTMKEQSLLFPRVLPSLNSAECSGADISSSATPAIALTADQYTLYKNRAECMKNHTIGKGCAQCYGTNTYTYIGDSPPVEALKIHLAGKGTLNLLYKNNPITKEPIKLDIKNATVLSLGRIQEGERIVLDVSKGSSSDGPFLFGYFSSTVPSGKKFQMALDQLDAQDIESGASARKVGFQYSVNYGARLSIFRPAAGKKRMQISITLPFTFVEQDQLAAFDCMENPLIGSTLSAEQFSKDPCSSGKPGSYSEDCLKEQILEAGCSTTGDAYKNPKAAAGSLGISEFVDKILRYANMKEVDREAALQCVGQSAVKKIETPCDTFMGVKGAKPATLQACMSFLYSNASEGTPVGSAYPSVLGKQYTSMGVKGGVQYCTPNGTLNPEQSKELEGIYNGGYKGKRGIAAVKEYLSDVFTRATDDSRSPLIEDSKGGRANSITKCFRTLRPFPEGGIRGAISYPKNYTLGYQTQPVVVLGMVGMEPWAGAWGIRNNTLNDNEAKWIWRMAGAQQNEPSWAEWTFLTTFVNTTNAPINAVLHCVVDNRGTLLLNNKVIASTGGYTKVNVTFPPGQNLIEMPSMNQGGPAGLCVSAQQLPTNKILFHTDETWKMKV